MPTLGGEYRRASTCKRDGNRTCVEDWPITLTEQIRGTLSGLTWIKHLSGRSRLGKHNIGQLATSVFETSVFSFTGRRYYSDRKTTHNYYCRDDNFHMCYLVFFFPLTFCLFLSRCLGTPVIYISNCLSVILSPPLYVSLCHLPL